RNRRGDLRQPFDGAADLPDRADRLLGCGLNAGYLLADLAGGLRRLFRERLHFRGHDRKTAAGLAGTRRLDGGVERQQIGLAGDGVDQFDDVADASGRLRQFADALVGVTGLTDRLARHPRRFLHLTADLIDRRGELFGGGGDRLHIGRSFFRSRRHHGGQLLRALGGRCQRGGGGFEFGRGRRHGFDDLAYRPLETVGELKHVGAALRGGANFRLLLLTLHADPR